MHVLEGILQITTHHHIGTAEEASPLQRLGRRPNVSISVKMVELQQSIIVLSLSHNGCHYQGCSIIYVADFFLGSSRPSNSSCMDASMDGRCHLAHAARGRKCRQLQHNGVKSYVHVVGSKLITGLYAPS